jgi:hypothetical protein
MEPRTRLRATGLAGVLQTGRRYAATGGWVWGFQGYYGNE